MRTRRTAAVTVTAGLSLTAALTLALPGIASASTSATVLSSSTYVDGAGFRNVVGEVQDTGTTNLDNPSVTVTFFDAAGNVVDTDWAVTYADRLAPGEKAPFHEMITDPTGYDHYTVTASGTATTMPVNHDFTTVANQSADPFGVTHLAGTIRNDNTTVANDVKAIITMYDASGTVVDSASSPVNPNGTATLDPGATGSFDASGFTGPSFATYAVTAESSSPASPASASPSPSPTPTATPTSAPPASTGTPSATETTPTVSVSPAVISAGQLVTVTYHGTPNSTLEVWSKTQPATAYSEIRTITLDATGTATSTHTPRRNTRIMAKTASGLASTQPLISVRSIASINAKRVGTRTFTFSGSVLPALTNRLVDLYRNGTLVAQARTSSTGVYSVTKTLAGGTFSFQVKTPNDTYNLGTASAVKSLRIS